MSEEWRDVVGYTGHYQVSDLGRVRSVDREIHNGWGGTKRLKGRTLKQGHYGANPYDMVSLSVENKRELCAVHALVAAAFFGPRPSGYEVCHGPNGKQDNGVSNLYYGTRSQNQLDRFRDGTVKSKPVRRGDGKEYPSLGLAAREAGLRKGAISKVCRKLRHSNGTRCLTAGGFSWEFV